MFDFEDFRSDFRGRLAMRDIGFFLKDDITFIVLGVYEMNGSAGDGIFIIKDSFVYEVTEHTFSAV